MCDGDDDDDGDSLFIVGGTNRPQQWENGRLSAEKAFARKSCEANVNIA